MAVSRHFRGSAIRASFKHQCCGRTAQLWKRNRNEIQSLVRYFAYAKKCLCRAGWLHRAKPRLQFDCAG